MFFTSGKLKDKYCTVLVLLSLYKLKKSCTCILKKEPIWIP